MEEPLRQATPGRTALPETRAEDRLDSWKEIAAYLKRDVTTVQRWEKREGMPVHRHLHDRMGSVYAWRTELDAWTRSRGAVAPENGNGRPAEPGSPAPPESGISAGAPVVDAREIGGRKSPGFGGRGLVAVGIAVAVLAAVAAFWLWRSEYFWRNPIANARFETLTDFDGVAEAASISGDGRLVAFLSDRDGPMDVWVTQVGSGEYHNLTHGTVQGLTNPLIRALGFSPDASLVTFWVRKPDGAGGESTATWAVPTLGGAPRVYLDGAAEFDWSRDGRRLAYHTSAPGDPMYVSNDGRMADARVIFTTPAGLHSHFPLWSPDGAFVYFVHGTLPDKLDIWRVRSGGGRPERITSHNGAVIYPVLLDGRTLVYLASDADGSGPSLYSMDVERRVAHRLSSGIDRYTSLAASADGRRLVAAVDRPKRTLWRLSTADPKGTEPVAVPLNTGTGFAPRLGSGGMVYVVRAGSGDTIRRVAGGADVELWSAAEARVIGGPAISADGRAIAFAVRQDGRSLLYAMQADGTNVRVVTDSLELEGDPAWAPDGRSIAIAAKYNGAPRLVQVSLDGRAPTVLVGEYALDPAWSADGRTLLYSGPDVGTTFRVKAVPAAGAGSGFGGLTLTRGGRHLVFLQGGRTVVFLEGDIDHKNVWEMDLDTGAQRELAELPVGFDVGDFDISPDGREMVLERVQDRSDLVMMELGRR